MWRWTITQSKSDIPVLLMDTVFFPVSWLSRRRQFCIRAWLMFSRDVSGVPLCLAIHVESAKEAVGSRLEWTAVRMGRSM